MDFGTKHNEIEQLTADAFRLTDNSGDSTPLEKASKIRERFGILCTQIRV